MSDQFKITVDANAVKMLVKNLDENVIREVTRVIKKWNMIILNEAIEKVNVDRGQLQTSLNESIVFIAQQIVGKVGSNMFYARYIHGVWKGGKWIGPKPHFVPFKVAPDLIKWAKRKGYAKEIKGELYRADKSGKLHKIKGIFMKGKPNPFIANSLDKYRSRIIADFAKIDLGSNRGGGGKVE